MTFSASLSNVIDKRMFISKRFPTQQRTIQFLIDFRMFSQEVTFQVALQLARVTADGAGVRAAEARLLGDVTLQQKVDFFFL